MYVCMYVCMYDLFGEPHFDNLDFQSILYIYIYIYKRSVFSSNQINQLVLI